MDRKLKVDDPVGAVSVHLVCGVWGTLAVGLFSTNPEHSFMTQLIGVGAYAVAAAGGAFLIFSFVKAIMGLRVSKEEEMEGLDYGEHDMHAYDLGLRGGSVSASDMVPSGTQAAAAAAE